MDKYKLIIIIGLPDSGKTYLSKSINKKSKNEYNIYDDFIQYFYDGRIIKDLQNQKNIIINDPRLCNYRVFRLYMNIFRKYVSKKDILLILFKNKNDLTHYSKVYDITKYNKYNNKIMSVYNLLYLDSFKQLKSKVKNVIYDVKKQKITIEFENNKKIYIVAYADCCSESSFFIFNQFQLDKLIGNKILSFSEIDDKSIIKKCFVKMKKKINIHRFYKEYYLYHVYNIKLDNGNFYIGLVNLSNGFYDGWIEIFISKKNYFIANRDNYKIIPYDYIPIV